MVGGLAGARGVGYYGGGSLCIIRGGEAMLSRGVWLVMARGAGCASTVTRERNARNRVLRWTGVVLVPTLTGSMYM